MYENKIYMYIKKFKIKLKLCTDSFAYNTK